MNLLLNFRNLVIFLFPYELMKIESLVVYVNLILLFKYCYLKQRILWYIEFCIQIAFMEWSFLFCEFIKKKNILIPRRFCQSRLYYSVKTDPDLCVEKYRQNYLLAKRYDLAVVLQLRYWKISVNPLLSFSIFGDTVQYLASWIVEGVEKNERNITRK